MVAGSSNGSLVSNSQAITLAGALTTSGANPLTLTTVGSTNVTFPTSGTLATTSEIPSFPLSVSNGGTSLSTLTSHALYVGNGTSAPTALGVGTTGQALVAATGSDPSFGTLPVPGGGTGATTLTGLLVGNGTSAVTASAITQHDILVGGASNAVTSVAPSVTSGVPLISQGASSDPAFGTAVVAGGGTGLATLTAHALYVGNGTSPPTALAVGTTGQALVAATGADPAFGTLPVAGGGTGATTLTGVLTGNGTSAVTASTVTQYAVLVGGASNAVGSVSDVATGQVLVSGGVSANPAFSAYPQVSGLGVGASAGSTAGITFDGTNFLNIYSTGTFTPTLVGQSVAGTTTYVSQNGYYTRIGNMIFIQGYIGLTAATGTGNALIGALPFTIKNQSNYYPMGAVFFSAAAGWVFPIGTTSISFIGFFNTTTASITAAGTAGGTGYVQMANATLTISFSLAYQI